MSKLTTPVKLITAFGDYTVNEQIGQGGAGRVFGGSDADGAPVAVKVLSAQSSDKKKRFQNETAFLLRNRHPNIVSVIDHGFSSEKAIAGPFYVMHRFSGNLRDATQGARTPEDKLKLFLQILDGVEAAHLQGVVHRDLKPENVLFDGARTNLAIADFGVAMFSEELLVTAVETGAGQRLANFQYAAPEQRVPGRDAAVPADVYALGLMLNELFTGHLPHGTDYEPIGQEHPEFRFLDPLVTSMLKQNPNERPQSVGAVKELIKRYRQDAVTMQRLSELNATVIPAGEVDDPLAFEPPQVVGATWDGGVLHITLDRPVNQNWIDALRNMGSYSSAYGAGPERFVFAGKVASVPVEGRLAQSAIDHFKGWMPQVTAVLKYRLETQARAREERLRKELEQKRHAEEQLLKVNAALRV